jgi:hypothetical protein
MGMALPSKVDLTIRKEGKVKEMSEWVSQIVDQCLELKEKAKEALPDLSIVCNFREKDTFVQLEVPRVEPSVEGPPEVKLRSC